jgi:hypothetical protein
LDGDDEQDEVFCEGLWPAELSYLCQKSLLTLTLSREPIDGKKMEGGRNILQDVL